MAEPLPPANELRDQLAATFYEIYQGEAWDNASEADRAATASITDRLVPVFADWLTGVSTEEVFIAHQRAAEAGCLCGWADLDEHHSAHVLTMLAEPLGSEA